MESDDENLPMKVISYPLGVRRRRRTMQRLMPVVYDVRGKNHVVSGKVYNMLSEPYSTIPFLRSYFAEKLNVSEELVYVGPGDYNVVIHENSDDLLILFIVFTELQFDQSFNSLISSVGCIGLNSNTSVSDLQKRVSVNTHFRTGESVCLFLKDKRLDNMSMPLGTLVKKGDSISCVSKREEIVQCFHLPRPNIENKYSISCFNTDTVGEIREAFKETFHEEFEGLESGVDAVWFTQGKHIVKDEEMLYLDAKKRAQMKERGRLFVHIKPAESVPVTVRLNISGKESFCRILFVTLPITSMQFRQEASVYTDHPPNALQLYVDNQKVRGPLLSDCKGFIPNCIVNVKIKKKACLKISLQDGTGTKNMTIEVYKLDTVSHLKESLAKSRSYDIHDVQVIFDNKEMKDEDILQDYRIRSGDTIYVRIFQDSATLLVRQPGHLPFYLTVNKYRQCTVYQLKKYLLQYNQILSPVNVILQNRCLRDSETLEECGLVSGNTVLLTRSTKSNDTEEEGIKRVFFSHPRGTFQMALAVEVSGMLFYAPDSVPLDIRKQMVLRKHDCASTSAPEMMIRKILKPQLLMKSFKSNQFETTSFPDLQMTAPNSRPSVLAIDKVQVSSIVTQTKPPRLKYPTKDPTLPGYHSDPEFNTLKRFTYCKELAEGKGRFILREHAFYEEGVSKTDADKRFALSSPGLQLSPECAKTSQEASIHRSPSLLFPTEAVQNSILHAVSLALGLDWTRLALALGLDTKDIEELEYRHSRSLHDQALQALLLWKQRASKNATVVKLKEALHECGLALIADSINENVKYETT